jgi:hypothetical protein
MDPKNREHLRARLLQKNLPSLTGTWVIRGEDDNADLAGPHYTPKLGKVRGTYAQAVDYALSIPSFVSWGRGGSIDLDQEEEVIDLDNLQEALREKLFLERDALNRRIDEIENTLRAMPRKG